MSRVFVPDGSPGPVVPRPSSRSTGDAPALDGVAPLSLTGVAPLTLTGGDPLAPAAVGARALQQELADLRREIVSLRTQRQRDMATARGLGESLQSLRRGAMALRTENEELRRQLAARPSRRR